jgi:hypothetical protein
LSGNRGSLRAASFEDWRLRRRLITPRIRVFVYCELFADEREQEDIDEMIKINIYNNKNDIYKSIMP